jgi:hypothetical protein
MKESSNIFFVENIFSHIESKSQEVPFYSVVLLRASENLKFSDDGDNLDYQVVNIGLSQLEKLHEGQFTFFRDDNFENANSTPTAKRLVYLNNLYRGRLMKRENPLKEESSVIPNSSIFSYHINVGHGNCSMIVLNERGNFKIWMIDCSEYDYLNHKNYRANIDACFDHICQRFLLRKIHIDKFFLTHSHFDHYSGMGRLIDQENITSRTDFFLNLHFSMPGENYNRLLRRIVKLRSSITEPLSTFNTNGIEVWHPHLRTIRTSSRKYRNQIVQVESKPNNSSAVFYFNFGNKAIIFPGDIETIRWNTINLCYPHLRNSNYFLVSHHGSLNGHLRNVCPVGMHISNLSDCIPCMTTPILMGREGAYRGIYSNQVINDFRSLLYSEYDSNYNPCHFLEMDWQTNIPMWY